jgi:hypothetical protein
LLHSRYARSGGDEHVKPGALESIALRALCLCLALSVLIAIVVHLGLDEHVVRLILLLLEHSQKSVT